MLFRNLIFGSRNRDLNRLLYYGVINVKVGVKIGGGKGWLFKGGDVSF